MHQIQHVRREVVGQAADNNEPIGMHECLCRSNARSGGGRRRRPYAALSVQSIILDYILHNHSYR